MLAKRLFKALTDSSVRTRSTRSASLTTVSYRVMVSVHDGLHRGAAFVSGPSELVFVGRSPECDLVLADEGVPNRALCFFVKGGRLVAKVISPGVYLNGEELPQGTKLFEAPSVVIRIGGAGLRVEMLRRSRRHRGASSGRGDKTMATSARNKSALVAWGGLSLVIALAVGTGAVNASFSRNAQQASRTLNDVVASFNTRGAQIEVSGDLGGRALLRGLVVDESMREILERDLHAAGLKVELQLHDVRLMGESLTQRSPL